MTQDNVIDVCDSLEQLEIDYNNWMMLTDNQKDVSNDICMQMHGCNNIEFYEKQKQILSSIQEIQEAVSLMDMDNLTINGFLDKVEKSFLLMSNDPNVVIIPLGENIYQTSYIKRNCDSNIDLLYKKYQELPQNFKNISNGHSLDIWGVTVDDAYAKNKAFMDLVNAEEEPEPVTINSDNVIESCLFNINNILNGKLDRTICENTMDFSDDIPQVVPLLTYTEYSQLFHPNNLLVSDYISIDNPKKYFDTISNLQNVLESDQNINRNEVERDILKLGWFPYKKINGESLKEARDRQIKWYNENMSFNFVDLTKFDVLTETEGIEGDKSRLEPLFLTFTSGEGFIQKVIKKWTKNHYCHAGISLSSKMDKIYSFNAKELNAKKNGGGFVIESLESYSKTNITDFLTMCFFVDKDVKKKIKEELAFYEKNKDATKYNKMNYFNIAFNIPYDTGSEKMQMVCSQFVDYILKLAGIDITNKSSNLVTPANLVNADSNKVNIYVLFEGKIPNYKSKEIDKKISFLVDRLTYEELSATSSDTLQNNKNTDKQLIESVLSYTDNEEVNKLLKEMRDFMKPNYFIDNRDDTEDLKKISESNHRKLMECGHSDIDTITEILEQDRGIATLVDPGTPLYENLFRDFDFFKGVMKESSENNKGYAKYYQSKIDSYNFKYDGKNIFS